MKRFTVLGLTVMCIFFANISSGYALDSGFTLNLKANFGGTYTQPKIDETDLASLGANYMKGGLGFIIGGELEVGYIFGADKFFGLENNNMFSGLGVFGYLGVGQGSSIQSSGSLVKVGEVEEQVDVYFSAFYTPVADFGITLKSFFFNNRFAVSLGIGAKMIADTTPTYEFYSSHPEVFPQEVGTIIVTEEMIKQMNPLMLSIRGGLEYYQPIVDNFALILGGYLSYNIYDPKFITMPPTLLESAIAQGFDPSVPLKSFRLNSLDFGISIGLSFRG